MAKKTTWKCQHCGLIDTHEDDMEFEMVGVTKPVKKRYHKECFEQHLIDKAFKAEEQIKKDALNETIKEIYGVKELPNPAWTMLEALRGGNPVFRGKQQNMGKRYKEGYDYLLIKATFEYCSDTIEYWNGVKPFNGFMGAFTYAMSIIIDKVYVVEQRVKHQEKQEILIDKHLENTENSNQEFETNYKKPSKSNADITDFLDD